MFARLTALVSSAPAFPYVTGQPYEVAWGSWTHYRGTKKEDSSEVSIFRVSAASRDDQKLQIARNGVKRLKLVRHPNILAFRDTFEFEEKGEIVIYLVTEPVTPLSTLLGHLDMDQAARSEFVAMGLYHIAKAVSFLNNDCSLVHGNVCMRAVVVTPTLDWRLHGFDLLSEHAAAGDSSGNWALPATSWMVPSQYKAAEVGRGEWQVVKQSPPWAVDSWGLGCLMQEAFGGKELLRTEDLRNIDSIPKPALQDYQRLLASAPARRLNPAKLGGESGVLRNKLVDTIAFLENLSLKDSSEKDTFFKRLPSAVPQIPLPVAQLKLLPMLAGALEYGGAPASALAALLQIGQTLSPEEFKVRVVPALSKLFASNDRSVRRSLLESIDTYGPHLSESAVEEQIYPHVATGFTDTNAYLRELTLKSMLVLAPKLSQRTLNQSLLKFLAKLQVDEEAAIRANTTILLGNLAQHLSEPACKRVLLNAFTRALKDGFPPARIAGLKAMVATAVRHNAEEAATRVLPAVVPLAVDPVQEVRHTALAALDVFVQILRDHNRTLDDSLTAAGTANKDLQQAATAGGWSVGINSNLGWAMSSFGLSRDSKTGSPGAGPAAAATTGTIAPSTAAPSSSGADAVEQAVPMTSSVQQPGGARAVSVESPVSAAAEGWDNPGDDSDEGWDDPDPEEAAARAKLSRVRVGTSSTSAPSSKSPVAAPAPASVPAPAARDSRWASNDGDEDRWEDMDAASNASHASAGSGTSSRSAPLPRPPRGAMGARRGGRLGAQRASGSASQRAGMKLGAQKLNTKLEDSFEF